MNIIVLTEKIQTYLNTQINKMALENPMVGFVKPIITRVIDNNLYKLENGLKLLADQEGNIDMESILSEMIDNVISAKPFKIPTDFIGDLEVGNGAIKFNLPWINKSLSLSASDLKEFKDLLSK